MRSGRGRHHRHGGVGRGVAKIRPEKPLFRLLSPNATVLRTANPQVLRVYAAGYGYYYPGKDGSMLRGEMRGYLRPRLQRRRR